MAPARWTREDVVALVRDRFVLATDESAHAVDAPDWVRAVAVDVPVGTGTTIERTHPDHRPTVVNTWIEALSRPGEVVECESVSNIMGSWARSHVQMVNLVDHPDVGCLLVAAHRLELLGDVDVEHTTTGEADTAAWAMVTLDRSYMIRRAEGLVEHIFACPPEEVLGRNVVAFWHPDALSETVAQFSALTDTPNATYSARRRLRRSDGTDLWVELHALRRFDHEFGEHRVTLILHDISARRAQEEALRRSHDDIRHLAADFRLLAEEVPSAVFRCDADGTLTFHNSHWAELLDGVGDDPPARVHDIAHPDERVVVDRLLVALRDAVDRVAVEVRAADGRRTFAITCRAIDDAGGGRRIIGSVQDVTATIELRRQTRIDALTGVLNRTGIEERLRRELAEDPLGVCVAFIDLDRFKDVNDRFGHEAGDRLLVATARRLIESTRPDDAVGRFGGDEFVVVFHDADEAAGAVRERLDAALRAPLELAGTWWEPAASIGVAMAEPDDDLGRLLRRADHAMFAVKRARHHAAGAPADGP